MDQKDYVARISQATPIDLSIISSEICIGHLNNALKLIDTDKINKNEYHSYLNKAKEIVLQKIHSFNTKEKLGKDLGEIFFSINKLIADAQFSYNKEKLLKAIQLVEAQMEIFIIAKKNKVGENDSKVINTSEKIIAGLTYSNGKLNEFIDDGRGQTFEV